MTLKTIIFLFFLGLSSGAMCQSPQKHASKGWKYIDKKEYSEAKKEFEFSLAKDTLPGNLSGMSYALRGLNDLAEAKRYLLLLTEKYPKHRFTKVQVDVWNKAYPDNAIDFKFD